MKKTVYATVGMSHLTGSQRVLMTFYLAKLKQQHPFTGIVEFPAFDYVELSGTSYYKNNPVHLPTKLMDALKALTQIRAEQKYDDGSWDSRRLFECVRLSRENSEKELMIYIKGNKSCGPLLQQMAKESCLITDIFGNAVVTYEIQI